MRDAGTAVQASSMTAAETSGFSGALKNYAPATLQVWITDGNRRIAAAAVVDWTKTDSSAGVFSITLNPQKKYQEILGFGGAFSDASCFMFNQLSARARAELFHRLFDPSEMGLNVCRTCIGSADSATEVYSYDEGGLDPDLNRFSIDRDRRYN